MGLHDGFTDGSRRLMVGGVGLTFAQHARVLLENCFAPDEQRLCVPAKEGGLGYEVHRLSCLQAGKTIIVAPATGAFGGTAVQFALAIRAGVIAIRGNEEKLWRPLAKYGDS
ncbi:hypothetical protein BDW22DRAFT_1346171 [Trametopsis cervina]|nr:hypothetical protein BDW22DRAFT_1346171 [Trametopsis cervina]